MTVLRKLDEQGALSFGTLQRTVGLFPSTLNTVLKELEGEEKIEKTAHKGNLAYQITKIGKGTIIELGILGVEATEIMQKGGIYHDNYSNWRGSMYYYHLPWGIKDDIVIEKSLKKINPVTEDTANKVHKLLYQCIKEDVKNRKVHLDKTKDGKIILGFTIYYKDLVESINEQSLFYLENMTDREQELLAKWEDRAIKKTEMEEFKEIRKRTKVKGGVRIR